MCEYEGFKGTKTVIVRAWIRQTHVCTCNSAPPATYSKGELHSRTDHESPEGKHRCSSTLSLTSVLDCGGWSQPRSGCFTPVNKKQVTNSTAVRLGSRVVLDGFGKSRLQRNSIPGPFQPVASHCIDYAITTHIISNVASLPMKLISQFQDH